MGRLQIHSFIESAPTTGESDVAGGVLLEAQEGKGFRVRIMRAGLSGNRNYYPDAALREGAPLFEGARVIVKADGEHLASRGRDPRAVLGRVTGVTFVPGEQADSGVLEANFEVIDPADPMIVRLREAVARGMGNLFGLSIDARGYSRSVKGGVRRLEKFQRINSVDLIVEPGADGRVLDMLEAAPSQSQDETMLRDLLLKLLRQHRPAFLEGKDEAAITDEDLSTALQEALANLQRRPSPPALNRPCPAMIWQPPCRCWKHAKAPAIRLAVPPCRRPGAPVCSICWKPEATSRPRP